MGDALKVAIVGSRTYSDLEEVGTYVSRLPAGTTVITGGASGVDSWAEGTARGIGLPVIVIRPDYATHGRAAPLVRNGAIVAAADRVVAFWDGQSSGTADTIRRAHAAGRPLHIHYAAKNSPRSGEEHSPSDG